jgi:hypothetical protein
VRLLVFVRMAVMCVWRCAVGVGDGGGGAACQLHMRDGIMGSSTANPRPRATCGSGSCCLAVVAA